MTELNRNLFLNFEFTGDILFYHYIFVRQGQRVSEH